MDSSSPVADSSALLSPAINLWRALEARRIDPAPIFRAAGIDPAALGVPGKRVSARTTLRLQRLAEEAVPDPALGLEVARQMQGTASHALGYAWLASATLGEAFHRFARYSRVVTELWSARIEESSDGVRVTYVLPAEATRPPDWLHDWLVAGAVRLSRLICGDAFAPLEVALVRERPADVTPFEEWFRSPIRWRAPQVSLLCRSEDFSRPLPTGNPEVAAATERVALDYLARLDRERHRHAGEAAHPRKPALGRAVAGRRGARARAQPAHPRPAARGGGNELHRDPRRDPPRARPAVSAAHRLLGRRGGLPRRVRGVVELQPRVPAVDRCARRATPGRRPER